MYHYKIRFPQDWEVGQVQEEERVGLEESSDVDIRNFKTGEAGSVEIKVQGISSTIGTSTASTLSHNSLASNLESFAKTEHQKEIDSVSLYSPDLQIRVGSLQESTFAGKQAFFYNVSYIGEKRGNVDGGKYTSNYLFVESNGVKFLITYSLESNSIRVSHPQEIANSFEFTK